jgi:DNA-binding ferritin-like protein
MVEKVEVQSPETTTDKPVEETKPIQSKPEGLPEKFNSVDELVKSYSELEKKLGEQSQPTKESVDPVSKTEVKQEQPKSDLDIATKAVDSAGLNMDSLAEEYAKDGKLADGSYKSLEKAGIPKEYVDRFIAGQQAIADQQSATVKNLVGGTEAYDSMSEWAGQNLTETEKQAYNTAVNSKDLEAVKLAVVGLKARYAQSTGSEPQLVEGKASPSGEQGFASWAQVTQAMSDPRYAKDPAYQAEVKNKLANSKI